MEEIDVLVISSVGMHPGFLDDIEDVDPRVRARDATQLFVDELRREGTTDPLLIGRLEREVQNNLALGADLRTEGESLDSLLNQAEVMFGAFLVPKNVTSRAPRLKLFHLGATGIDRYLDSDIFDGRIVVTTSRGAIAIPIAEHVIGLLFMLAKNAARLNKNKAERLWDRFPTMEVTGRTLGIIGMGAIGSQVARMASCLGMRVIGTRRSATKREHDVGCVDEVYPREALCELLADSDFVVLALPLTHDTRNLIGEREFRAMKDSAHIINVSRGNIVDEQIMIRALREGWIAGAGLDVFDKEPLPAASELWGMPNVIVTHHMAGLTDRTSYHVSKHFCENLKRFVSGQELINVVSKRRGY